MKEYIIDLKKYQRPCIYMLMKKCEYIIDDLVVYVGKSKRGIERIFEHKDKEYDYIKFIPCPKTKLDQREKELIEKYKPRYNEMLKPKVKMSIDEPTVCCYNCKYADFEKYVEINKIPDEVYYDEIVPTYCTKHQKNISDSFNMSVCSDFKMFKLR